MDYTAGIFGSCSDASPPSGITAAILREMSYSTLRFGMYEPIRDAINDKPEANSALLGEDMAGFVRVGKRMFAGASRSPNNELIPPHTIKILSNPPARLPTHRSRVFGGRHRVGDCQSDRPNQNQVSKGYDDTHPRLHDLREGDLSAAGWADHAVL